MDYTKTQHAIQQSPELALRQEEAFAKFAPQEDEGSLTAAYEAVSEQHYGIGGYEGGSN